MKSRITPYYVDLIYDAALKSFWRKSALRKFLRECGISEIFLPHGVLMKPRETFLIDYSKS